MPKIVMTINHEAGLHARPLAQFVQTVNAHDAEIQVMNITNGKGPANGASPLQLLLLAALKGHEIEIDVTGDQAEELIKALEDLVSSNFGED